MKFGICGKIEQSAELRAAGADFVEENVQTLLEGTVEDKDWKGMQKIGKAPITMPAANCLVPATMKVVGPMVNFNKLQTYMARVVDRAAQTGIKILVFGSGGARKIPDGFDPEEARDQILKFCKMAGDFCAGHDIQLVLEPLNRAECNVLTTVGEAMTYIKALNHPNVNCLVDSYHFWVENEPLENLEAAMPWIRHVHVADMEGRVAPGESGKSDYVPFFSIIKNGGYEGHVSVESPFITDLTGVAPRVMKYLRQQWDEA